METALNDFTKWKADDSVSNPERHNNVTKAHFQRRQGNRKTKQKKQGQMLIQKMEMIIQFGQL